jgi:hypothetical protein
MHGSYLEVQCIIDSCDKLQSIWASHAVLYVIMHDKIIHIFLHCKTFIEIDLIKI